jgi:hypothetical protein
MGEVAAKPTEGVFRPCGGSPSGPPGHLPQKGEETVGFAYEFSSSTFRPSERISFTSTLNDSGMPASKLSSPRTIAS